MNHSPFHDFEDFFFFQNFFLDSFFYSYLYFFVCIQLGGQYNQERLLLETIYVVNKKILHKNPQYIIKSGVKSRVDYNGACKVLCIIKPKTLQPLLPIL